MRPIFSILFLFLFISLKADFKGRVFMDSNKNGVWDNGEKYFAGVLVTNGKDVVKTTSDGTFVLPEYLKSRYLSITVPSGYRTSDFYLKIEKDKDEYNFLLEKSGKKPEDKVSFIHISDTESYKSGKWIDNIRDYAKNNQTDFIIHSGDICYNQGLRFHRDSVNSRTMGVPMYYSIGNHDLVAGNYAEESFELGFGPCWYSFEEGGVHFIVAPMPGGDYKPSYSMDEVLIWLENDLKLIPNRQPIVVINHDLLINQDDLVLKSESKTLDLSEYNLIAWIYGHWHINYICKHPKGSWLITTSPPDKGGIDHSPSTFRVINIDSKSGKLETENRYTYVDKHLIIVQPSSSALLHINGGKMEVSVNTYHTSSPIRKVKYSITAEGEKERWNEMQQMSDWNWTSAYVFSQRQNKEVSSGINSLKIKVHAETMSGELFVKEETFKYLDRGISIPVSEYFWTNLRGNPAHDSLPAYETAPRLIHAWTKNVRSNIFMTSPIVAGNKVFVATIDDALISKCKIVALNSESGETVWEYPTRNSIKNTIVYAKGKVFAVDASGYLYAVAADNGKLILEKRLEVNQLPAVVDGVLTDGNTVYAGSGKGFCAIDANTMHTKWCNSEWNQAEGTVSTPTFGDSVILSGAHWRSLYAHNASSGKLLWKLTDNNLRFRDGTATFKEGKFYLASGNKLYVLDARTGEQEHVRSTDFSFHVASSPLLFENLWITGTADKGLLAVDVETLKPIWTSPTKPSLFYTVPYAKSNECSVESSPVVSGRYIYFGSSDGFFYVVNPESGRVEQVFDLGAPIFSSVAIAGRMLYISDFSGNVHAFLMQDLL